MSVLHVVQSNRHDWLEWRREGIGGSDAAAVVGLSPFGNPWTVWADKRGLIPLERPEDRARRAGRLLEPVVIEWFTEDTGIDVRDRQVAIVRPGYEWMRATLDGRAYQDSDGHQAPPFGVVEVKTSNGLDGQWVDGVPLHIVIQAQHQIAVDEAERAYVAVLLRGDSFLWFQIDRDEVAISELMEMEERFWRKNVLGGEPPDVDGSTKTAEALRAAFARPSRETTELPATASALIADYLRASMAEREAKDRKQTAANKLMALMGDAEIGTVGGRPVVRWPLIQRKGYTVKATEYRKLAVVGGVGE
jgi:putative phage-type endonuclease